MTYGSRVITLGAVSDAYAQKYKGIGICLELFKRAFAGNYVNFGVFDLYGDPALKVSLLTMLVLHHRNSDQKSWWQGTLSLVT